MSDLSEKAARYLDEFMLPTRQSRIVAIPRDAGLGQRNLVAFDAIRAQFADRTVAEIIEALDEAGASVWVRP